MVNFFYRAYNHLDGSILDTLDYNIILNKYTNNVKLFILCDINSISIKSQINQIINERYKTNILINYITTKDLLRVQESKLNIFMGIESYDSIKKFYKNKNCLIISEHEEEYHGSLVAGNVFKNYKMKFAFSEYRPLKTYKNNILLNICDNKISRETIDLIDTFGYKKFILKSRKHIPNLFEQFNTYMYIDDGIYFDPHPRLFHECYFYDKDIIYISGRNNGACYRYVDLVRNGLNGRILDRSDEVIQYILRSS